MFDWGYLTELEPHLNGRRIEAMRGKVLGGSSSIHVMVFTRGHPGDYDRWAQKGAWGWSYGDVLPYFKRCETRQGGANYWRGGGPVGVEWARTRDPLYQAWMEAALAAGFPVTDEYNGERPEGFGRGQYSIRKGRRSSAAAAPAWVRKTLTVATGALATRVLLRARTRSASSTFGMARSCAPKRRAR
jgi:choline dehydrogenase-like flavoprotein